MKTRTKTLRLRVSEQEKIAIQQHAQSEEKNESEYIRSLLLPYFDIKNSDCSINKERKLKTNTVKALLYDDEKEALNKRLKEEDITISFFLVRLIRQELNAPRYLSQHEVKEINQARNELRAIGRNLNQLVAAINSGNNQTFMKINENYLERLSGYINNVVNVIGDYLGDNFTRVIRKMDEQ